VKDLITFARSSLGIEFFPGQLAILSDWARSGKQKCVLVLGRRSGKTEMAAAAAIHNAVAMDYSTYLRRGEARFVIVIANRIEQAMEFIRVVRELLEDAPDVDLLAMVDEKKSTTTQIRFSNGAVIRAMPCNSRPVRGVAVTMLVLDEAGQMSTNEGSFTAGHEIYRAAVGGTIQFKDQGYVMVTSTPGMFREGILWDLFAAGQSGAATDIFVAQRPVWEVNPTITRESLESLFIADPSGSRAEYGAEFVDGAGAYFDATAVAECVMAGRTSLPPLPGVQYRAVIDPALAKGGDAWALGIGHRVGTGEDAVFVMDRLESWRGKRSALDSDATMDANVEVLREYRITDVLSDQYSFEVLVGGFRHRGITLKKQATGSDLKFNIMGTFSRAINTGHVELLDHPASVDELRHIQMRPTPSGKPKIEAASGYHDDLVVVLATLCHALKGKGERDILTLGHVQTLGAINTRLLRTGPLPAPFGFGTTGRSSIQDPGDRDFNMAIMAASRGGGGVSASSLSVNERFIAASPYAEVHAWAQLHNWRNNDPEQVDSLLQGRDPADVILELDAAVITMSALSRQVPGTPSWKHVPVVLDDRKFLTLLQWALMAVETHPELMITPLGLPVVEADTER